MVPTSSTQRHAPSNNGDRHSSVPWTAADDTQLIQARQQNMNWGPIAKKYFPNKTPNACRKRHERLMEKRNLNGAWNAAKFDQLAKAYAEVREPMWKLLAEKVNEKWQTVEIKCMDQGIKNLLSAGRSASRRDRLSRGETDEDFQHDSGFCDVPPADEGISEEHHPFSAGSHSSRRTTMSSTTSATPSLSRPTPTLPNFSQGFNNLPGIQSIVGLPRPPVTSH